MNRDYYLLNHLDDPLRFFFFTMDEFLVLAGPLLVGMLINKMLWGALCSLILYKLLTLIKKLAKGVNLRQLAYWFLPTKKSTLKLYVPSYYREFQR
jgi:type IV conjugative transfer system protein TraL